MTNGFRVCSKLNNNNVQVLLMEQHDQYYKLDNWPPESDRMQLMRLASEAPLQQHILVRVLMMGLSKEHPFTAPEALELADQLVRRAATTATASDNTTNLLKGKVKCVLLFFFCKISPCRLYARSSSKCCCSLYIVVQVSFGCC